MRAAVRGYDIGDWQKRLSKTVPAEMANAKVTARLPAEHPLVCYLSVTDQRNVTVSTPHVALPTPSVR